MKNKKQESEAWPTDGQREIRLIGKSPKSMSGGIFTSSGLMAEVVLWLFERHGEDAVPEEFQHAVATGTDGEISNAASIVVASRISAWLNEGTARFLASHIADELSDFAGDDFGWIWVQEEGVRLTRFLKASGGVAVVSKKPEGKRRR